MTRTLAAIDLILALIILAGCSIFTPPPDQTQAERDFEQLADTILLAETAAIVAYDAGEISQQTWDEVIAPAFFEIQDTMTTLALTEPGERRALLRSKVRELLREIALAQARDSPDEGP